MRLLFALVILAACTVPEPPDAVWVTIPAGSSVEAVAESLTVHGIVGSAESFARFARMGRRDLGIKPGVYPFRPNTPMGRVLVQLRKGRPPVQPVTIASGSMLWETAQVVAARMGMSVDSVLAAAADPALRARVGARAETVDGYLYPTRYYVPVTASAREVISQMLDTFETRWNPRWNRRLDTLGLTRDELVTLASIIEVEAAHDGDLGLVSSVYHNRLTRGMRLQADPTVVYALGRRRRLFHGDYDLVSPYNTYRVDGLPPGPIAQPSVSSLKAALYPQDTEYLYFVARRDGRHEFSRTYREHLATIRRVRHRRGG